jgi:hypothetical protein
MGVPPKASAFAVVFAFANPALVASSGTLYPQFGVGVALLAAIAAWSTSERKTATRPRLLFALGAGLLLGIGVMLAPGGAAAVVAMLFWAVWRVRRRSRRLEGQLGARLAAVAVVAVGVCLVVTPWFVRNALVFGRFPLLATSAGGAFLGGNMSGTRPDTSIGLKSAADETPPPGLSESGLDQFYVERGLENVSQQPVQYAQLYLEKVAFGLWPTALTVTYGSNPLADAVQRFYYGLLYLGLLAWLILKKRSSAAHPWIADVAPYLSLGLLMAIATLLSYAALFVRLRYRLPTDVPLGLFAGLGAYLLYTAWSERGRESRRPALQSEP